MSDLIFFGLWFLLLTGSVLVPVFGGGALLYVGARYLARIPGAGYWNCVGTNIASVLAVGLAVGAVHWIAWACGLGVALLPSLALDAGGLLATWVVIMALFRTTFRKAVLAWLPTLPLLVAAVLPIVLVVLPTLELLTWNSCQAEVRGVGEDIQYYVVNNNRAWPPDLQTLARVLKKPGYICPSTSHRPDSGDFDYFYLPPDANAPISTIVLCDYGRNHPNGYRSVLYVDLHVGHFPRDADFQKAMAAPCNAAFAKALRNAEGPQE